MSITVRVVCLQRPCNSQQAISGLPKIAHEKPRRIYFSCWDYFRAKGDEELEVPQAPPIFCRLGGIGQQDEKDRQCGVQEHKARGRQKHISSAHVSDQV